MANTKPTASRVAIEETFDIPGYNIYNGTIPKSFTLRAMTTMEEKLRLSATGFDIIPRLIQACVVSPEDVEIDTLKLFDIEYLMYKLRIVTYGNDYHLKYVCEHCGEEFDLHINLDDIEVKEVPEDMVEPFEIGPLPISGDVLTCKIPTIKEYLNMIREGKRIKSKNPKYVGDPEFILNHQGQLVAINGKELEPIKFRQYVEQLHARDLIYWDNKYNEYTSGYGMDTIMYEFCPHCGEEVKFKLPVTEEFFRPLS